MCMYTHKIKYQKLKKWKNREHNNLICIKNINIKHKMQQPQIKLLWW